LGLALAQNRQGPEFGQRMGAMLPLDGKTAFARRDAAPKS